MAEGGSPLTEWGKLEFAIISGLRSLRDRYLQSVRGSKEQGSPAAITESLSDNADLRATSLCGLPVDLQLYIMSFLSPKDLCQLGMTSHHWYLMVQDRLLWRYFLLRDLPTWSSVEWQNVTDFGILNTSLCDSAEENTHDYMSFYLKNCPKARRSMSARHPIYGAVTSFLQSLIMQSEPRFAMFGPGLEQLDDSLFIRMMTSPDLLPVISLLQRQNHGVGWGAMFQFDNQKFKILVLHFSCRSQQEHVGINTIFLPTISGVEQQATLYTLTPQVKEVCKVVDGFIYVANAESHKRHNREDEIARILAMTDPLLGPQRRPFLVLSCVTQPGHSRIPALFMAHELCLNKLNRPWMVQNTEASTLAGLLDGIEWILGEVGRKF
ncbi:F-box only protein 4-like [Bombina bombina]|uniref:F-box only protein 4-like n=1 Tax=Bombina bombina TaxID=8345 RepID=UPI00235A6A95|nr:F-box only protein 4-like [Bombina bombina]